MNALKAYIISKIAYELCPLSPLSLIILLLDVAPAVICDSSLKSSFYMRIVDLL